MKLIAATLCVFLSGCATTKEIAAVDTFCLTASKIKWSKEDTPETIQKIEVHNAVVDKRCHRKTS